MEEIPILSRDDGSDIVKQFISIYDAPAYMRRERQVHAEYEQLLHRCRTQRDEWLKMVRVRLGLLHGLAGDWDVLKPLLEDEQEVDVLRELFTSLSPRLLGPVETITSTRVLRRALQELVESIEHFNHRWLEFLPSVSIDRVNELRQNYNKYYLIEKECAFRSPRLARQGFQRMEPLRREDLWGLFPVLGVPRVKS